MRLFGYNEIKLAFLKLEIYYKLFIATNFALDYYYINHS